jgi:hypothetical protein
VAGKWGASTAREVHEESTGRPGRGRCQVQAQVEGRRGRPAEEKMAENLQNLRNLRNLRNERPVEEKMVDEGDSGCASCTSSASAHGCDSDHHDESWPPSPDGG